MQAAPPFCHESGGSGPALVLLHGFGGSHIVWRDIVEQLAGRCRILAYDLPGHGWSLNAGSAAAKAAAAAILANLANRGVETAHVVGHSLGGAVAILMAVLDASRVESLVLLAPGGIGPEIDGAALMRLARAKTAAEISGAMAAMSAPSARIDAAKATSLAAMREAEGQIERLVEIADAIGRNDRQGVFPASMLAGISCPVDVAWGTLDPVLPFAQTGALPAGFSLKPVAGAGHMLIEESPDAVVELIEARLAKWRGSDV